MARPSKVWYRESKDYWFVTLNGKKVNLFVRGRQNEALAWKELDRLKSSPTTQPPPDPSPPEKGVTVKEVVSAFLKSAAGRVEKETHEVYRLFLNNFASEFGDRSAAGVTCEMVEAYSWNPTSSVAQPQTQMERLDPFGVHGTRHPGIPARRPDGDDS